MIPELGSEVESKCICSEAEHQELLRQCNVFTSQGRNVGTSGKKMPVCMMPKANSRLHWSLALYNVATGGLVVLVTIAANKVGKRSDPNQVGREAEPQQLAEKQCMSWQPDD
ncbi:hypothetical protein [Bradyrhizobium sp. I1.7.5]|uniref:hypothetical protein n=1 Tax=Bradyrhizobium sp. I1.7.5 TaxID=3156363 RepID=UPI003393032E